MAEVIRFKPRTEIDADANLRSFVALCRDQLTVFGSDLVFDDAVWDVSEFVRYKGKPLRRRIYFCRTPPRRFGQGEAFLEPYLSFAKAYLRHESAHRGEYFIASGIKALRALNAAMADQDAPVNPTKITSEILNRSFQILVAERSSNGRLILIASELEKLGEFLVRNHLIAVPLEWKSPLKSRVPDVLRVGKKFDELRAKMLPSPEALAALANIFRIASEPVDVLVSSIMAILCAAPSRVSEMFLLPADCEVVRNDSKGGQVYSLRWYPGKGAPPQMKSIITSMVDVVREALDKIRALTKPGRTVAAWYERHPTELYLPSSLAHMREKPILSIDEVGEIVFAAIPSQPGIYSWLSRHTVRRLPPGGRGLRATYAFADVEAAILGKLPRGFPWVHKDTGLKYSEALFCHLRGLRQSIKPVYRGAIELMGARDVQHGVSEEQHSIFDRFGFVEKDGSPIRVRTHQLRHYLNTLAQAGGLSQLDIALWSGRANIHQNAVYDHVSDRDALAILDENTRDDKHVLATLAAQRKAVIIKRDEFERLQVKTAHTTEFGFCVHDFAMLPCQLHMDCLNCDEHLCLKGDRVRNENLRRWRDETKTLIEHSITAESIGVDGADRWTQHQTRTLTRVEQILEVYDDQTVPNGSVIQPACQSAASWTVQGREERGLLEKMRSPPCESASIGSAVKAIQQDETP